MLQWVWIGLMGLSILYALVTGKASTVLPSALEGSAEAIALTIRLGGGYVLFCGLMEITRALGAAAWLEKRIQPLLRWLMPGTGEATEAVTLNLSMNVLGLGNAATPMGIEAMRRMEEERQRTPSVKHDMYMLLILNATSLQLLPTTVLTLRAAAGSAQVNAVIVPTLICTAVSTVVGAALGWLCRRRELRRG